MKSYFWFIFGCSMVFIVTLLTACGETRDGMNVAAWQDHETRPEPPAVQASVPVPVSPILVRQYCEPDARISLAGERELVTSYEIRNTGTSDHEIRSITLRVSNPALVTKVGYALEGAEPVEQKLKPFQDTVVFDLSEIVVPAGEALQLDATIAFAELTPMMGWPKSGDTVTVELVSVLGQRNVPAETAGSMVSPLCVVHASAPWIKAWVPKATVLKPGTRTLYAFDVTTSFARTPATVKQFRFEVAPVGVDLCNFHLRRGTEIMHADDVAIWTPGSAGERYDLSHACVRETSQVVVWLAHEERIDPTVPISFALVADVGAPSPGATVRAQFSKQWILSTGDLGCGTGHRAFLNGSVNDMPAVLWSDLSANPHSDLACYSSRDWIGDAFMFGLDDVHVYTL